MVSLIAYGICCRCQKNETSEAATIVVCGIWYPNLGSECRNEDVHQRLTHTGLPSAEPLRTRALRQVNACPYCRHGHGEPVFTTRDFSGGIADNGARLSLSLQPLTAT